MAGLVQGRMSSPHYVHESDRVLLDDTIEGAVARLCAVADLPALEPGGPREYIYFDPSRTRAAIVTCGGLCPGLNNVIRGLVLELADNYGVTEVLGFRDGFRGLAGDVEPVRLTHDVVAGIHNRGGTILGTSRGSQDPALMVDTLERLGVSLLFVIGGDGTLRGAAKIADEAERRGLVLSVIGVPKTIDNDIPYLDQSFGFQTAFTRATDSIKSAHTEASSTPHGVGLVKVMGRHSGFIACYAALASHDADFVLIPEVPFFLDGPDGFLARLRDRVRRQGHAVVVVAEGAGQATPACPTSAGCSGTGSPRTSPPPVTSSACATSTRDTRSAACPPTGGTRCTACGWPRPPCTPRWPGGRRWSSAAGTGGSCTCRFPSRPAAATRSTRTVTCGSRCSRRLGSRCGWSYAVGGCAAIACRAST
jgi:6-phosphofructokinase